jgi:four helix bundle protein
MSYEFGTLSSELGAQSSELEAHSSKLTAQGSKLTARFGPKPALASPRLRRCEVQDFRNLKVWKKAHQLVLQVYSQTANFPRNEMFGLTSQIRRAAVSVAANVVEGSSRAGDREFARFLHVALASTSEVEYFSILLADLRLLEKSAASRIGTDAVEVRRMLLGLLGSLPRPTADPRAKGSSPPLKSS